MDFSEDVRHRAAGALAAACFLICGLAGPLWGEEQYRISTLAGEWSTLAGYSGDGGPATKARLREPRALAWGPKGELYIADGANHVVRAIDSAGNIRTVAGGGTLGDGALATQAVLTYPGGIAFDSQGNLYIEEGSRSRIRRVSPDGIITTFAGTGLRKGERGDEGPATQATLPLPRGIAVGPDDAVYVTDALDSTVRRITPDGVIHTFAHLKTAYSWLGAIALDPYGNVYVADGQGGFVVKIDRSGAIQVVAGRGIHVGTDRQSHGDGGPALDAYLVGIGGVVIDTDGTLLIADGRVRRVGADGVIRPVMGLPGTRIGPRSPDILDPARVDLRSASAVLPDANGNLYVADTFQHRVWRLGKDGVLTIVAGVATGPEEKYGGSAKSARFQTIPGIAASPAGELFVVDNRNNRVVRVDRQGMMHKVAGKGLPIIRNHGRWDPPQFSGDGGPAVDADLDDPYGIALDAQGNIYIADSTNHRIRMVSKDGRIRTIAGTGVPGMAGDNGPAHLAQISRPEDLAIDRNGNLYFFDWGNDRVRRINPRGILETLPGLHGVRDFQGMALDRDGNLYLSDWNGRRIVRWQRDGTLLTIAGTGKQESSGDGGPAAQASLRGPLGLAFDHQGNLYVCDLTSIRKISRDGIIRTIAGNSKTSASVEDGFALDGRVLARHLAFDAKGRVYAVEGDRIRLLIPARR